jgi:hypothetical protein
MRAKTGTVRDGASGVLAVQEGVPIVLRDSTSGHFEENPPWDIEGKHLKRPFEANYSGVAVTVVAPYGVVVVVMVIALRVVVVAAVTPCVVLRSQSSHRMVLRSWWLLSCMVP